VLRTSRVARIAHSESGAPSDAMRREATLVYIAMKEHVSAYFYSNILFLIYSARNSRSDCRVKRPVYFIAIAFLNGLRWLRLFYSSYIFAFLNFLLRIFCSLDKRLLSASTNLVFYCVCFSYFDCLPKFQQ